VIKNNFNVDKKGDFIFRWKLEERRPKDITGQDALTEFVRDVIKELLDVVVLTYKGEELKIDGFQFMNSTKINKLY